MRGVAKLGVTKIEVKPNTYRDSLILMKIANTVREMQDINSCTVLLATEQNKTTIVGDHLLTDAIKNAGPNDLMIVIDAKTEVAAETAYVKVEQMLVAGRLTSRNPTTYTHSLENAIARLPDANLAILSIPGKYVKAEAMKAIDNGLNLHIFSDNVPIEEEREIKLAAQKKELLVMGPDSGTANISGFALAFANKVSRGPIGIVGAAGTGIQEVSTLIHRWGSGVSHAIGTGSNDIKNSIGGITMIEGLKKLAANEETKVIVICSKPPEAETEMKILQAIKSIDKPVVVNFLGGNMQAAEAAGGVPARTLEDAAWKAVQLTRGAIANRQLFDENINTVSKLAKELASRLNDGQKYVRGVYTGGTLANEACLIASELLSPVYINTALGCAHRLKDTSGSIANTFIDVADDEFTQGKPHAMAEPAMRFDRIIKEMQDPETAVLLLDFVLGYGVHQNPAGALAPVITRTMIKSKSEGRFLPIVVSVTGVEDDPQVRSKQVEILKQLGCIVMPSNAQAARMAAMIASRDFEHYKKEVN